MLADAGAVMYETQRKGEGGFSFSLTIQECIERIRVFMITGKVLIITGKFLISIKETTDYGWKR